MGCAAKEWRGIRRCGIWRCGIRRCGIRRCGIRRCGIRRCGIGWLQGWGWGRAGYHGARHDLGGRYDLGGWVASCPNGETGDGAGGSCPHSSLPWRHASGIPIRKSIPLPTAVPIVSNELLAAAHPGRTSSTPEGDVDRDPVAFVDWGPVAAETRTFTPRSQNGAGGHGGWGEHGV